jgi:hypothetical protein
MIFARCPNVFTSPAVPDSAIATLSPGVAFGILIWEQTIDTHNQNPNHHIMSCDSLCVCPGITVYNEIEMVEMIKHTADKDH